MDIKEVRNWFELIKWICYKVLEKPETAKWEEIEVSDIDVRLGTLIDSRTYTKRVYILRNQWGELDTYEVEFK